MSKLDLSALVYRRPIKIVFFVLPVPSLQNAREPLSLLGKLKIMKKSLQGFVSLNKSRTFS